MCEINLHVVNYIDGYDREISDIVRSLRYRTPWLRSIGICLKVCLDQRIENAFPPPRGTAYCLLIGKRLHEDAISVCEMSADHARMGTRNPIDVIFVKPSDGEVSPAMKELHRKLRKAKYPLVHYPRNERELEKVLADRVYAFAISQVLHSDDVQRTSRLLQITTLLKRRGILLETMLRPKDAIACYRESLIIHDRSFGQRPENAHAEEVAKLCASRQKVLHSKLKGNKGFYLPMPVYYVTSRSDPTVLVGLDVCVLRGFWRGLETLTVNWFDTVRERSMDISALSYRDGNLQYVRGEVDEAIAYDFTVMSRKLV